MCKKWNQLIQSSFSTATDIVLEPTFGKRHAKMDRVFDLIRTLGNNHTTCVKVCCGNKSILQTITSKCPNLQHLKIPFRARDDLRDLAIGSNLRHVHLSSMLSPPQNLKHTHRLELIRTTNGEGLCRLRTFTARNLFMTLSDESIQQLGSSQALSQICLVNCRMRNSIHDWIAKVSSSLTEFTLDFCYFALNFNYMPGIVPLIEECGKCRN